MLTNEMSGWGVNFTKEFLLKEILKNLLEKVIGGQFYGTNPYKQNFRNPQKFVRKIPYKGTDTLQIKLKKSRFPYGYSFSLMQPPTCRKY